MWYLLFLLAPAFAHPFTIASWNTMLQPWFIWSEEVVEHVNAAHADVLALQEVWTTALRDQILEKTPHFPYHYWPAARQETVGCNMANANVTLLSGAYIDCLLKGGIDTQTVQQPLLRVPQLCMQYAIGLAIVDYDPSNQLCLACLINTMEILPAGQDAFGALAICAKNTGPKYGHSGLNGQLILSKYPLENVKEVTFPGFIANRVNIHATIQGIKFGFGHFAFNLLEDAMPALGPLMYGALQPDQVKDFVDAGVDVIVGDMNSGPNYQPQGFNLLWESGYHQVSPDTPTWCDVDHESFLPCQNSDSVPMEIDHIFVRNQSTIYSFFPATFNEKPLMSDHIGVKATIYNCWWCWW